MDSTTEPVVTQADEAEAKRIWEEGHDRIAGQAQDASWMAQQAHIAVMAEWIARHRLAHEPAPVDGGEVDEWFDLCRGLIQEAKGAEGPSGGFVTNHLDAAEGWLDKIESALRPEQADRGLVAQDYLAAKDDARRLAVVLWEKHFRENAPDWRPLTDLRGIISQIDNMTAALAKLGEQP